MVLVSLCLYSILLFLASSPIDAASETDNGPTTVHDVIASERERYVTASNIEPDDVPKLARDVTTWKRLWQRSIQFPLRLSGTHGRPPTHMVVCPRTVRPSSVYRCVVSIFILHHSVDVRISVQMQGLEIASARADVIKGVTQTMLMQIPSTVSHGECLLRVEGNHPGTAGGSVFRNVSKLHLDPRFLTVLIQTNRPVYTGDQMVRFRVILLNMEQKPYDDPVDIFVLDPDGYVMRRWPSQSTNVGVVSMAFQLPFLPKTGWWTLRAVVGEQRQDKKIRVTKWYTPRFETKLYMQKYFLETSEFITGSIEGEFGNDKGVYGNCTVRLYSRHSHDDTSPWTLVSTLDVQVFDGGHDFELPMADVIRTLGRSSPGGMIRVEAEIHEEFMSLNQTGWAEARIINSSIDCRFLGSQPYVVVPGMPYTIAVGVSYHDEAPVGQRRLEGSRLLLRAEAVMESGARQTIAQLTIPPLSEEKRESVLLERVWRDRMLRRRRRTYYGNSLQRQQNTNNIQEEVLLEYDYGQPGDAVVVVLEDYSQQDISSAYHSTVGGEHGRPKEGDHPKGAHKLLLKIHRLGDQELLYKRMQLYLSSLKYKVYREKGVLEFPVTVPEETKSVSFTASYSDEEGGLAAATARAIQHYSPTKEYIAVETSTREAMVGHFAIFHVRANCQLEAFNYLVLAKELLLYSSVLSFSPSLGGCMKTLSLPVSPQMTPSFKILVYSLHGGQVLADSITVPVGDFSTHNVTLVLNKNKDHQLRTLELGTYSTAGAFYGMSGARAFAFAMQAGNELSHTSVMQQLYSFTNDTRSIHRVVWRDREGHKPDDYQYFVAHNYGPDANRTFEYSGVLVFTDANVGVMAGYQDTNCTLDGPGFVPCLTSGCYPSHERCNGRAHCHDGSDESDCSHRAEELEKSEMDFRVHQFLWFADLFDTEDGDWNWMDFNIGYKGHELTTIGLNKVDDPYIVTAFSISAEMGFGLIQHPIEFLSLPPVYISLEMPSSCRRGEQVGVRVMVFNTVPRDLMILVTLHGGDQIAFVEVEEMGSVDFFSPRISKGDHQHLISVNPEGSVEVIFPVVALIDQGNVEVEVSAIAQVGSDFESATLTVTPEGARNVYHTSTTLDLDSRGVMYEHFNIVTYESYAIPGSIERRFVAGSRTAYITLSGDVFGPTFPTGKPVNAANLVRKRLRGTEASAFNFGANLWTLHYLRLTNQLELSEQRSVLECLNLELAAIMRRFDASGAFRMWDTSSPSVWLTAWTLGVLQHAQFPDWENLLFIQPKIFMKGVSFLLEHQHNGTGAFMETDQYQHNTLDKKGDAYGYGLEPRNISLSAQVLLTLHGALASLQGPLRARASGAKRKLQRYLERELVSIGDPYEMAITAYALSVTNSVDKELAYNKLDAMRREQDGLVYWSRKAIKPNLCVRENSQKSSLQPKEWQEWDAHAVEATSYALQVYLIRDGINTVQKRIMKWLNSMRLHDGGFISTLDTLVAMQALTEYSYRARLRDITNMAVTLETRSGKKDEDKRINVNITTQHISRRNTIPIKNVWGTVNVMAQGTGQAILQMDVSYGVDWQELKRTPPVKAFDLTLEETFSTYGNKSVANVRVCARWLNTEEYPRSGAVVLEVENPTGYVAFQLDAERSVEMAQQSGDFPSLRDTMAGHGDQYSTHTVWYFDYIPGNATNCFEYTLRRWYPVANMTAVRIAMMYEQHQPERFEVIMFNSSTYSLDVCEVCASYQCPYCPIYSGATTTTTQHTTTATKVIGILLIVLVQLLVK